MTRTPTTTDTTVEWEEKVTDPDSDQLTITLVLDAVDDGSGFTDDGTDSSNLSWLSFSKDKGTLADGTTEVLVNIVADKSGLDQGYSYRFKITADDGTTAVDRTFDLEILTFGKVTAAVGIDSNNTYDLYLWDKDFNNGKSLVPAGDLREGRDTLVAISKSENYVYYTPEFWSFARIKFDGTGQENLAGNDWSSSGRCMYYHTPQKWLLAIDTDKLYRYDIPGGTETIIDVTGGTNLGKMDMHNGTENIWACGNDGIYVIDPSGSGSLVKSDTNVDVKRLGGAHVDERNDEFYAQDGTTDLIINVYNTNDFTLKRTIDMTSHFAGQFRSIYLRRTDEKLICSQYNDAIRIFDKDGSNPGTLYGGYYQFPAFADVK